MAQQSLNHRRYLGGGATFELGIDAGGLSFDVPVNQNARTTIANMPLGEQVLVPRSEFLGVGGTRCRAFAPDVGTPDLKNRIGDMGDGIAQLLFVNVARTHIAQIGVRGTGVGAGQPLEASIGSQAIETQKQPPMQNVTRKTLLTRDTGEHIRKACQERGFFEHIA
nr:hypothetical protein [Dictyobacter arantiisoli]